MARIHVHSIHLLAFSVQFITDWMKQTKIKPSVGVHILKTCFAALKGPCVFCWFCCVFFFFIWLIRLFTYIYTHKSLSEPTVTALKKNQRNKESVALRIYMPVYIFHVWTNDRRSNQMNATKMCSVALNRFPHMLWFDVSIKRMKEGEKKRKTKCKMRLFYSTIAIVCHGFFSTCLSIYSALSIHLSFFLYSQLTDTKMTFYSQAWYFCVNSFCVFYVYSNLRI